MHCKQVGPTLHNSGIYTVKNIILSLWVHCKQVSRNVKLCLQSRTKLLDVTLLYNDTCTGIFLYLLRVSPPVFLIETPYMLRKG